MDERGSSISDYRSRLDKTLASPDLTNQEMVHSLVKSQILQALGPDQEYTDCAVERRSKEVFKFLNELRSASRNDSHSGWKVKQDTEELRVMYRQGPEGTPFHTLLAEGYVDGPVDVCLRISCDSDLYKNWWPQIAVPTFRITASECVQKVLVGEQISIVRMKLSWPMSSREAVVHYFAFEYFQDDLVVVLIESISDSEAIDRSTHGFSRDGIPEAEDVVRMDLYGGFALKKVTADRSFFRTIANLDVKLSFVPPAFINFLARQLIGSGFKLYKKEVVSAKDNVRFQEGLRDPLYARVRVALYGDSTSTDIILEEKSKAFQDTGVNEGDNGIADSEANEARNEIEEKGSDRSEGLMDEGGQKLGDEITEEVRTDKMEVSNVKGKVNISPEVERALGTLEKAISMLREYNINRNKGDDAMPREKADEVEPSSSSKLIVQTVSDNHGSRRSNCSMRESKIAPDEDGFDPSQNQINVSDNKMLVSEASKVSRGKNKKLRLCCLAF